MDVALLHHSLDGADEPFRPAPELVVKAKPPEQDLDFTVSFLHANNRTNHEPVGKPLGIERAGAAHPKSQE
jgi:hypothetical protein